MRKKIMFFTPSLNIGGIERVFITYANNLCNHHDITYVCKHELGEFYSLLNPKIHFHSLGKNRLRQSLFALSNFLKKETPDILITGGNISNCLCLLAIALSHKKIKIIMSQHNYFDVEHNNLISKVLIRLFYNKSDAIVSVSNGITNLLTSQGVRKNKIYTIYNPIDIEYITKKSQHPIQLINNLKENYIISVGRLDKVKNITLMIDAFCMFHTKHKNLKLLIVGDGKEKEHLEVYIKSLNMNSNIFLIGATDNPFPYILNSNLVLSTSLSEALPTVFLESFALGKTIVATPTLGAKDLLKNQKFGYISNSFNDPISFAETMEIAYNKPISSQLLNKEALNYSVDNKIKELENLLNII